MSGAKETTCAIGSVVATDVDEDEGDNADLEYRIVSVDPSSNIPIFSIDSDTGLISAEVELDRETETDYELTVEATDGVGSASTIVQVTVLDINDCQPTFDQGMYTVDISENLPTGSSVTSVGATDCDEGDNAELRYSISGGDVGVFQLGLLSGAITTLTPLDFEVTPRYSLTVLVTDLGQPIPLTGSVDVIFTVVDFNDCPPEFINAPTAPQMPVFEDTAINSVIQTYSVQDCDSGLNGVNGTRFSIVAGNEEGVFEINAVSGVLRTVVPLDREEQDMYVLSIQAMDSAGVNSLSSNTELTVTVLDVNDNAPVLDRRDISIIVSEGESLQQTLLTLRASDADSGSNAEITYSLAGGEDIFVIDQFTGDLSLVQTLDREANDSYVLSVVASDRGSPALSSNATIVTVLVSDENDNDPEILNIRSGVTRTEVPEMSDVGFLIYTVNATDRDIGLNGNIRFSLDDLSLPFEMVGDIIRVSGPLDFEQRVIYSLVVVAEDRGIPVSRRGIATLVVEVTDENDSPPIFIQGVFEGTQDEDEPIGTEILRVQADDADSNVVNSQIAYTLEDSPDADFFTINNITGMIFSAAFLDREERDSYTFGVVADNYLSTVLQIGTAMVTITVGDVNDETPVFGQGSYSALVSERTPTNTLVLTVTATDNDLQNTPNSDLIFSLSRVTNVPFFIEPNTGNLIVQSDLDYERQTSYNFDVVVEDKGTMPLRNTSTISITIGDVNDRVPQFQQASYTVRLPENSPPQQIQSLRYIDEDGLPENTESTLSIVSVTPQDNGLFSISGGASGTGTIGITRPVDFEMAQSYALTVMVMNNNPGVGEACAPLQPSCTLSSSTLVNVVIVDTNDNPPVFVPPEYSGEISSTALTGTSILSVTATDGDATAAFRSVRYRLASTNPSFRISETTGTIFTRGSFEGLDGDMYTLNVFAVDNAGTVPFNEAMTTVNLIVLNDFQRIAIIFNISVEVISGKEQEIVSLLEELTGYDIVVEQYREYSTETETSFIFHAVDNGNIIDFDEFLTGSLEEELFIRLEQCRIIRIQSFGDLILSQGPVDTEIIVILVLCLFLIVGAIAVLITAFSQRYLALHEARHKLLADVFYGSHAGSSFVENIQQENIQLQFLESSGQATNKHNPMFVQPYDNWAVDTSGVESVGGDSNLQKDNPLYESQEIRMEMFADDASDEDEGDEADEAELLAAALKEDSDAEDEDNSVTAI